MDSGILKPQSDRLANPSDEDVEAANLVLSLLEPQPQSNGTIPEPENSTSNHDQMEVDQPLNDAFPTPSTPTHGKPQSTGSGSVNGSGGKQPKIVLRMPAGLTPK
ncbi:hypothetical protein I302_107551 [Kwoniella bestiolae CBS 10118]|uniref:Uncharacterized protein n=1 Tax=Kwoniella bestiolae CBS 10118 TaxID=1296100 RepID=A0A1B9FY78_9TREE|nr:hypothetical protein I302_06707 [Kwoniella bestiolae CBS 10118]OCF23724.1 hypothetical protein I302_06707 [Kwoniella bestiolae CBS 10118]